MATKRLLSLNLKTELSLWAYRTNTAPPVAAAMNRPMRRAVRAVLLASGLLRASLGAPKPVQRTITRRIRGSAAPGRGALSCCGCCGCCGCWAAPGGGSGQESGEPSGSRGGEPNRSSRGGEAWPASATAATAPAPAPFHSDATPAAWPPELAEPRTGATLHTDCPGGAGGAPPGGLCGEQRCDASPPCLLSRPAASEPSQRGRTTARSGKSTAWTAGRSGRAAASGLGDGVWPVGGAEAGRGTASWSL